MNETEAMEVSIDDKYTLAKGRVFISGVQALVRLPLMQRQRDARAGLHTAGFISGYRGSPLGGYDSELWRARAALEREGIRFEPGINEDLAATAVWGSQQATLFPGARYDGVFALWYGKGPGVDRSGDPLRHGNLAGSAALGGVLVVCGDDHAGKSSTTAHQSEPVLAALGMPVLYPSTVQDYIDFGLLGWALSRYSGLWVGFKCVNETVESTASVDVDPDRQPPVLPPSDDMHAAANMTPESLRRIAPQDAERVLTRVRMPRVHAFARANGLDRVIVDPPVRRLGLVAAGKSYLDVRHALQLLGIGLDKAAQIGIGLYKPGLVWPLEPSRMIAFAQGQQELMFVEEKRPFIEDQAARILYSQTDRPLLSGKSDPQSTRLLPADGVLDGQTVARAIGLRLQALGLADNETMRRMAELGRRSEREFAIVAAPVARTPYFCSGCPHNTSTRIPTGSVALGGIGCHGMAVSMERALTPTHMGGEGMNWVGVAPFTDTPHVFQNLGDGTYSHSGLLAIHGAVAAKARITYKILFNDAVAMTGGQPVEGQQSLRSITVQVAALGVGAIRVLSEDPAKYGRNPGFADGTQVHHRDALDAVQRELAAMDGVTVLIFDQICAAEKRRRRKRGKMEDPPRRAFVNPDVCEGCGDCSVKSNCVSVEPLETELGRKRRIDQASCNKDMSCINGFCPSFVTVHGGRLRKLSPTSIPTGLLEFLPEPNRRELGDGFSALIAGVGGSGVVTIGAVLGMAAHLEQRNVSVYDMTGLAQKGGAVFSHLRIAPLHGDSHAVTVGAEEADLMLGCDLLVSGSRDALRTLRKGASTVIVNTHLVPTGAFQRAFDIDFHAERTLALISEAAGTELEALDATEVASRFLGSALLANMIVVGSAYQRGAIPLSATSIERAIALNGVAVDQNRRAFAIGRLLIHDRAQVLPIHRAAVHGAESPTASFIGRRAADLALYQDAVYASNYVRRLQKTAAVEQRVMPASTELTEKVARAYYKLLAYKDEYEVARLYTDGRFESRLREQFEGDFKIDFHLAPPMLARRDPITGLAVKRAFGPYLLQVMRVLAKFKFLRGTVFDPFGRQSDRVQERALIKRYEQTLDFIEVHLHKDNYSEMIKLAEWPLDVRGFGHVKDATIKTVLARADVTQRGLRTPEPRPLQTA